MYQYSIVIGDIVEMVGVIMIAYMALAVHERVRQEHKIDKKVYVVMRRERVLAFFGMLLIVVGFLLRLLGGAY